MAHRVVRGTQHYGSRWRKGGRSQPQPGHRRSAGGRPPGRRADRRCHPTKV